jgi:glycosyltransferase involved in cell wall biosynthesis
MKVVIVGPAHPYRGGVALFNERLAKAFQENNDEVEIITFTLQYPNFLFPGKTQFSDAEPPKELKITRTINAVNPLSWIKTANRIKKAKPDLVLFAYWLPFMAPSFGTIAKLVAKNKHTKIAALVHNIIPHEKRAGDSMLSNYFIKHVDGFITLSKSVYDDLTSLTNKPKALTPHPLYDNFGKAIPKTEAIEKLGLDASFNYLLFFGIIRKYKGLDTLLEAMANEEIKAQKIKVIVAGEFYEDNTVYLDLIKKHQLENSVVLVNQFIPDEEVVNYFCAADLIVQPYKHATQSGVTQIAYHFNKPMLVTNVGGLSEMVPHQKVGYVTESNPKSVAESIIDFYINYREEKFVAGVKDEKQKYTWDKMTLTISNLFKQL